MVQLVEKLKDYECPICGLKQTYKPIASMTDKYVAISCRRCKILSAYPIPSIDELREYYSNYYPTKENLEFDSTLVSSHQKILEYLLGKIAHTKTPSFLDYGFGAGTFLKKVATHGFPAYGVEFSKQNCQQLQRYCQKHQITIHTIQIPDEPIENLYGNKFDCITLFQVIEHSQNPLELLTSLSVLLNPGGILYLECPNNDALYLKVKNLIRNKVDREDFFASLNPPQHLYGFNRTSMRTLLERCGYTPLEVKDYFYVDGLHQVETQLWYPSFLEWLKNRHGWNFYGFSKMLIGLVDPLSSKFFGAGGGLYALARKS